VHPEEKIIGSEIYKGGAGRAASMAQLPHKVTKLTALYIRREKGKTPPYSIAGEKFIDMKKRNLLLRLWLA
jgi:hypothetical protein